MKIDKIVYWIVTGLLSLSLVLAGYLYLTSPVMAAGFKHFGFPGFFRMELGIAKIVASLLLILPMVPPRIKEWTYIGVAIVFISAFIAHVSVDGITTTLSVVISFSIWAASFVFFIRINRVKVR
ncbi:hypothetical protein A4H97_14380 [Niastella yeongjuensis]|uniref:DoxX-like family protein n=1 Tax=Niastella yeongjuensis TaxID=354355 RepID=A0A1V9E3W7_9BACT|nr:DoxX family protein [Niastella yeongjuensis]OQP40798.1 hypothetical protein A4H97_14380 [Niastella yeongjuensis]SEP01382.1 DoxX-like family protein [Niastella yeongjuensis]